MGKKSKFRKYWSDIFSRSGRDIWDYIKGHVAMALLGVVIAIATSILSANGLLDKAVSIGYISDASNGVRTLVSLIILSLFYIVFSVFYYPPVIHSEQEKNYQDEIEEKNKKIIKLNRQLKTSEVITRNVKFNTGVQTPQTSGDPIYAYIEVTNNESYDLRECFAYLDVIKIRYIDQKRWVDFLKRSIRNTNELTFPNFNRQDEKIIRRGGKPERINIAKMNNKGIPMLIFADGYEPSIRTDRIDQMYIEVSLNGKKYIDGKITPIKQLDLHGFIKWKKTHTMLEREKYILNGTILGVWLEEGEIEDEK